MFALRSSPQADAKGCIKGAVVGGVAGHFAGHHAVVGAVTGCVIGRRLAKKHEWNRSSNRRRLPRDSPYTGGWPTAPTFGEPEAAVTGGSTPV